MSPLALWIVGALIVIPVVALSIYSIVDLVRRSDVAGSHKAVWIVAVIVLPLVGGVAYLIFRPTRPEDIRGFGHRRHQEQRTQHLLREGEEESSEERMP